MSRLHHLSQLRETAPVILPSLLLCDFGNLEREVQQLEAAGVRALHLDVMDGHFVPNLTYGMPLVEALRRITDMILDVHLMISEPERFIESFSEAGSDIITIHVESTEDPAGVLQRIRELGAGAGIAINPSTELQRLDPCLPAADVVLVMSVEAGFGGQSFNPIALERIPQLRQMVGEEVLIEVDGGINQTTISPCAEAGAQLFVVGSAIFRQPDYSPVVRELSKLAHS